MFDFEKQYKELEKRYTDFAKQVKQVNDFWVDHIISSLKQFTK